MSPPGPMTTMWHQCAAMTQRNNRIRKEFFIIGHNNPTVKPQFNFKKHGCARVVGDMVDADTSFVEVCQFWIDEGQQRFQKVGSDRVIS